MIYAIGVFFFIGYTITFLELIRFGKFSINLVIILASCSLVGNSLGILTGSLFKYAKRASAMTPVLLLPLMMFSGLYNKLDSIPGWISWLQYISPFRYGLHGALLNEFKNDVFMT
jgi:ABC-type multidrug transport system permease subunit